MKSLRAWHQALPVVALALSPSLHAQLAGSGTPGDRAVYTIGSGATLGTGFGTSVVHDFATTAVADTADSFDLQVGGSVDLTAGHHIVIYGTRYANGADARAALDTTIKVNGATTLPYGASASYSRDNTNNNNFIRGGTIIEVNQADSIEIESQRVDNHGQTITQQDADLQLVKLDDSLSFLRLGASANVANLMSNSSAGPAAVSYDVQDELDPGFAHTSGSSQITLNDAGHYLVFANTGVRISGGNRHRQSITQRLTLNGTPVEDSATVIYLRYAGAGDGAGGLMEFGAASLGMIIEATAPGSVLEVEVLRDNLPTGTNTAVALEANRTGLTILKLPGYGEYLSLSGPSQNINFAQGNPETALDLSDVSPVTNTSFTYNSATSASQVGINKAGDYLFLASHFIDDFDTPGGDLRTIARQGFQTIPSGGSAGKISYGNGGAYNRDRVQNDGQRARDSGDWAGAILPLGAGDAVETTTARFGGNPANLDANSIGLQALNIGSISSAPTGPVLTTNLPLNALVNSTGNVITDESHLKSTHLTDPPTALTYTIDTAPTGGTLNLSGSPIGLFDTFTQDDVDNDRLTFDAGAAATTGGFDFSVFDSNLNPVSGTFVINVGEATVLTDDAGDTDEDTNATEADLTTGADLLANDTGSSLSVTAFDAVSANGAAVAVTPSGTFTYNPTGSATLQALDDTDSLADTFDYTVTDIFSEQNSATVTITVDGLNDPPVVVDESLSGGERSITTGNLLANDSDVDANDILTIATISGGAPGTIITPKGATLTVGSDGSISYNPCTSATLSSLATGASDFETFAYEVTDGTATVAGSITFTTLGESGGSADIGAVDATGADSTNIAILANDSIGGAAGVPTPGAVLDLNAADVGNTDSNWANSGAGGGALVMEGAGTESVLIAPLDSPNGITAAYDLSGTGSGDQILSTDDAGNLYGSNIGNSNATIEIVFRPDDQVGNEPLWGSGGNGTGSSLVLLGNQVIVTAGQNAIAGQARGTISAAAVAGGEYVHVVGIINLTTDTVDLYINGVLVDSFAAVNFSTGLAGDLTDWSGGDDEGIGRSAGTTGGDIAVAPFLGSFGTVDIPDFNDATERFDGELAIVRVYDSALTPAQVTANFEAVFGVTAAPVVGDIVNFAGETNLAALPVTVILPSGASATLETDGTVTYDANNAFDDLGIGLSIIDSFTYTLDTTLNAVNTVKVTVNGSNPDPQINIAANQSNVTEGSDAAFTISSTDPLTTAVDVNLSYSGTAQDGSDFTGSAVVTLPIGGTPFTLNLPTAADALFEGSEDFTVTVDSIASGTAILGANLNASTTIDDSDSPPAFMIMTPAGNTTEGSTADFTVTSTVAASVDITLDVAYSGTADAADYGPQTQVTVLAGQTAATISLLAFDDGMAEGDETLIATIGNPTLGSVGAPDSATATIEDGAGIVVFMADFEGIDPLDTPGDTLLNGDAPFAANLGTAIGTWANVFTATAGGNPPGVIAEGGADVKGDGVDSALRLDRPGDGDGYVCAQFDGAIDITGSNTGVISFDLATRRTENNSIAKSTTILGLDDAGNKAFELFVDANNNGAAREQLFHVDSGGTKTPIGNVEDFNNSGNYNEDRMSNVRIALTSTGFSVSIDRFPLGPIPTPETVTSELAYAGNAKAVTQLVFDISGSASTAISGGIFLDNVKAAGSALTTQEAWRLAYFGSAANAGDGADGNDFNGNGLSNLLDFTAGFDPVTVGGAAANTLEVSTPGPTGDITQLGGLTFFADPVTGEVFMRYTRRADHVALGLDITDQFSRDLTNFEDATEAPTVIAVGLGENGVKVEAVELKLPLVLPVSGGKARFGRTEVQITP